jgi:hypothetical protein
MLGNPLVLKILSSPTMFLNSTKPCMGLFLLKQGTDTLLVQIYADDIIFGGSSHALVAKFANTMSRKFEMSMMGELTFLSQVANQASPRRDVRASRQVHQGPAEEV